MSGTQQIQRSRLLVVEDDVMSRDFLVAMLEEEGYAVEATGDAPSALAILRAGALRIEAVLLDWVLPGMSGLALLQEMKASAALQTIPVILQTALSDREAMYKGIAAGAFYYVTKPIDQTLLLTVVEAAVADYAEWSSLHDALAQQNQAISSLDQGTFRIRTLPGAAALAALLSRACPDPERIVMGLGELLANAVEHGNLGIGYDEKSHLLEDGTWRAEVARRAELPEHRRKSVEVRFRRHPGRIDITITDQGRGFDWRRFLTFSPDRLFHSHGRGIAMANMRSFDKLIFEDPGNRVTAVIVVRDGQSGEPDETV